MALVLVGSVMLAGCTTPAKNGDPGNPLGNDGGDSPGDGAPVPITYVTGGQLDIDRDAHLLIQLNASLPVVVTEDVVAGFFDEVEHHGLADPCLVYPNPHKVLVASESRWSAGNLSAGLWRLAAFGSGTILFGEDSSPAIESSGPANGTGIYDRIDLEATDWTLNPGLFGPTWNGSIDIGPHPWTSKAPTKSELRPDAYLITFDFETSSPAGRAIFELSDSQQTRGCYSSGLWSASPDATRLQQGFQMQAGAHWQTGLIEARVQFGQPIDEPELLVTVHAVHISGVELQPR